MAPISMFPLKKTGATTIEGRICTTYLLRTTKRKKKHQQTKAHRHTRSQFFSPTLWSQPHSTPVSQLRIAWPTSTRIQRHLYPTLVLIPTHTPQQVHVQE